MYAAWSNPAETRTLRSDWYESDSTPLRWPRKVCTTAPVKLSRTVMVVSREAEAMLSMCSIAIISLMTSVQVGR
jgi:hypothetical protein